MDLSKPEAHGPFTVVDVPNHPAADPSKETRAFYIMYPYDHRFTEADQAKDWVTANVVGNHEVLVKVPAWIFPMFPDMPNHERSFTAIKRQVHTSVEKSLNNALSIFDPENDKPLGESGLEARRWCFYKLDFSGVEGVGELSSKDVFDRAGPNEKLDFDLIEGTGDTILGFKVGVRDPSGGGPKESAHRWTSDE